MSLTSVRLPPDIVKQDWTLRIRAGRSPEARIAIALDIGPRIRSAREARKISLRSLAQRTGFSASFLSQVELGQSSPSLASLQTICDALDIDLPELLRDPSRQRTDRVVRKDQREVIRSEWSKATAESLLPNGLDDRFSALLISLDPGGRTGRLPIRRAARGFAYCIRGQVLLTLGDNHHELSTSDSVVIDEASSWENRGRGRAEVLVFAVRA